MATWTVALLLAGVVRASQGGCHMQPKALQGALLQCTAVDAAHFQNMLPNRTHWITCAECSLPVIDARTFPYQRNNISYLEVVQSRTVTLRRRAFANLYLLKVLNLRSNRIEYLEVQCFDGLKRLLQLDLSANCLQTLNQDVFGELHNLDVLNLSRNWLYSVHLQAFAGLSNLHYLYLNHNALQQLQERMFRHLAALKILYMEHNGLLEIHQNAFVGLVNLQYLYLNNNSIDFLVQYNFRPLGGLLELQLRRNRLREVQVSAFNGLRSLRVLHLSDNRIAHIKPYGFIGLDSLRVLDLVRNRLPILSLSHFDKMPRLHVLWLNDNPISEMAFNAHDDVLEGVEVLDLSGTGLRPFDYAQLYRQMPNLKELVLANSSLECRFFTSMLRFYYAANVTVCLTTRCSVNDSATCTEPTFVNATTPPTDYARSLRPPLMGVASALFLLLVG